MRIYNLLLDTCFVITLVTFCRTRNGEKSGCLAAGLAELASASLPSIQVIQYILHTILCTLVAYL